MIDRIYFRRKYLIPSIRLPGYDYGSSGYYAVTFCTKNRDCFLSEIVDGQIHLSRAGDIVMKCWEDLPNHFSACKTETIVVMPNHIHLTIQIRQETGQSPVSTKYVALGTIIRALKSYSSKEIHQAWGNEFPVWQARYYDHVIRTEKSHQRILNYFRSNPQNWANDLDNPKSKYFKSSETVETGL
jgi:putative transposase